jgi:hypothetical protein
MAMIARSPGTSLVENRGDTGKMPTRRERAEGRTPSTSFDKTNLTNESDIIDGHGSRI